MQPIVKPLSLWRRKLVFGTLLLVFLISMPAFIFYAVGYRYDFSSVKPVITVTGGFYILADAVDSEIFIDDKLVTNARSFRDAFYIQGLEPGLRRVHVQGPDLNTWVKELPVYPHVVTEVEAFNLPLQPQVRLVSEYSDADGVAVFFAKSSTTPVINGVATTSKFIISTSTATSTLRQNAEFVLLRDLFLEQASTTAKLKAAASTKPVQPFGFSTSSQSVPSEELMATTTVIGDKLVLFERGDDVWAKTVSLDKKNIPRYFCQEQSEFESEQIAEELAGSKLAPTETILNNLAGDKIFPCRTEIKIDRKNQYVHGFNFFPPNANLVLMHLDDGIYVVEVDDRSWQNTQLLYPGTDLEFIVYRGGIFVKQDGFIFEVLPEIASR